MANEEGGESSSQPLELVPIESAVPLSSSLIWRVQTSYYARAGINAWASGDVPHLLTSGPLIGRSYLQLIEAFVEDLRAGRLGKFDTSEPLYVIELGAGSGRLGFCLQNLIVAARLLPFRCVYVLSDRVRANVEFWSSHERLAPHFANGTLDTACFDPTNETVLWLEHARTELGPGSIRNPLVVVANYFFDVLPQDLYCWEQDKLYEEHVALASDSSTVGAESEEFFRHVVLSTTRKEAERSIYKDHRDEVLSQSGPALFKVGGRFLFPAAALKAIDNVSALSSGRALLLVGERPGVVPAPEPSEGPELGPSGLSGSGSRWKRPGELLAMGVHGGSMSLPVDLDLLALSRPSMLLRPQAMPTGLEVAALLYGEPEQDPACLCYQYEVSINECGPEDVYLVCKAAIEQDGGEMGLSVLLATLRLGGFDPYLFQRLYGSLQHQLADASEHLVDELERVLAKIETFDYPIDEVTDLDIGIASLLAPLGRYETARSYFERSCARRGARADTLFNLALCDLHLEQPDLALAALKEAIELDDSYEPARTLYAQVLAEQMRRTLANSDKRGGAGSDGIR